MSHMSGVTPFPLSLIVMVNIDPVVHGFDLSRAEAEEIVLRAINAAEGLEISPCCDLHRSGSCCDPDDCGPCCESCPECPAVPR